MPVDIDPDKMEEIQNSDETWIIDFWAEWCNPCQNYMPIFEEVSEDVDGVNFGKVAMHDHKQLAQKLQVRALPTTIVLKGGEQVARKEGMMQEDELKDWISENA